MKRFFKSSGSIWTALIIALVALQGCENGGIVGSSFVPTNPSLVKDTIYIGNIETESLVSYAGNKNFVTMGIFDDPLFGRFESMALLRPTLPNLTQDIPESASIAMILRSPQVYGDSLDITTFDIYEITRRWRPNEWRADSIPQLSAQPILSGFQFVNTDSLFVPLPQSFVDKYIAFHEAESGRDSLYAAEFFGLALVPTGGSKVNFINVSQSRLYIALSDTTSTQVQINQRASSYTITPSTPVVPEGSVFVNNIFTSTGRIQFTIDPEIMKSKYVSRAELVLYEDTEALTQTLGPTETRANNGLIRFYELAESEKEFFITKEPAFSSTRVASDGTYRVNMTSLVNSVLARGSEEITYYFVSDLDNGIYRPNLFVGSGNPAKAPKIIITRINSAE